MEAGIKDHAWSVAELLAEPLQINRLTNSNNVLKISSLHDFAETHICWLGSGIAQEGT